MREVQQDESFEEESPTIHHIVPISEYLHEVTTQKKKTESHINIAHH